MKNIFILILIVSMVLFSGCTSKETSQASDYLKIVNGQMLLAADKASSGDFEDAVIDYDNIKKSLEPYVYNEQVKPAVREEIKTRYNEVKLKSSELQVKINMGNSKSSVAKLLPSYEQEYLSLLEQEKNVTKEYKYNPEIFKTVDPITHCANFKVKIVNLKNKFSELRDKINKTETYNSKDLDIAKTELLDKVTKSAILFDVMLQDYTSWCDTRKISSDWETFVNSLNTEQIDYYKRLYCGLIPYNNEQLIQAKKRFEFMNSSSFATLKMLIKEKDYPFDPQLENTTYYEIEYSNFLVKDLQANCDFASITYQLINTDIPVIKAKYSAYTDKMTDSDKKIILSDLKGRHTSCVAIGDLKQDCVVIKDKYPKDALGLNCDGYSDYAGTCEIYSITAEKIETNKISTVGEIIGYN